MNILRGLARFLGLVVGVMALLFVLVFVFLNVHPVAWQYGQEFQKGTSPGMLVGDFDGTLLAPSFPTSWQGKMFRADGTGINRWGDQQKYPFTFFEKNGRLAISYDRPENSWLVRRVVDEVVRRSDGSLLGRITYRLIGDWRMPVGWFVLVSAQ